MSTNVTPPSESQPYRGALWHPFADMGAVESAPFVIDRGEGVHVYDEDGRGYIDASASLWYVNLGHGRPEIADAVATQLRRLDSFNVFGDYANRPALELADRLSALAPTPGSKIFFGSGGADMIDTAAKIARQFFARTGQPQKSHLISRRHGYHGTHGFGTSIGGIEANTSQWGPLVPGTSIVDHLDPQALEAEIQRVGPDRVAAFFCEPVMGAGGVRPPSEGYIEAVAAICRDHGVLLIADCVINAFGRLGTWLGIDRWPVEPDMITTAKGITSGTIPLGALVVHPRLAEPFFTGEPGAPTLNHGATYAGHPVAAAAAMATLDLYERDGLIPKGRELEGPLADALGGLLDHPLVSEVRAGTGLMGGVDLVPDARAIPGAPAVWQRGAREAGVLVRPMGTGVAVSPPLTITVAQIQEIADGIRAGLGAVQARMEATS
jgi:putrescine aminotransferase